MSLSEYSASYDTTINQRGQEPSPPVRQASRRMAQRRRTECINRVVKPKPKRMTPEEFIKEYTMGCSNDITPIGNYDNTYQE